MTRGRQLDDSSPGAAVWPRTVRGGGRGPQPDRQGQDQRHVPEHQLQLRAGLESVILRTFGVNVSQATLAKKMKTTTSGTYDKTALPVINSYINPLGYSVWDTTPPTARPTC